MAFNLKDALSDFFGDVAGDKEVKTQGYALAIRAITGSDPIIDTSNPNQTVIRFTKLQKQKLKDFFAEKMVTVPGKKPVPPTVRIEHKPLWMPWVIKKAIPYAIGFTALGFLIGKTFK